MDPRTGIEGEPGRGLNRNFGKNPGRAPRVLQVLKSSVYSGAEYVAITIIKRLQKEYEMAYAATEGEIRTVLEKEKIRYFLLDRYTRAGIQAIVTEFQPDIIHAHDFTAAVLCAQVRGSFRLISHLHYDPPWTGQWNLKTLAYTAASGRYSRILTVSQNAYENMIFADRLRKKCEAVGNPVDVSRIRSLAEENMNDAAFDLLFVGRLVEQKKPLMFLRIVNKLKKRGIKLRCAMVGDGELKGACQEMITRRGLQAQVKLLGFQRNPYPYMKASKLLCLTSGWEGYGLVLLEASLLGTPVLSSRASGPVEILGRDAPELCGSEEEFIQKITAVLSDEKEYRKWEREAGKRADRILTLDQYMERIKKNYQALL